MNKSRTTIILIFFLLTFKLSPIAYGQNRLTSDRELILNTPLVSANYTYGVRLTEFGQLELFYVRNKSKVYWRTPRPPRKITRCWMQSDGNLVLYQGETAVWASNTTNNPGAFLEIQDDGNLVIYTAERRALWASNTVGGQ